MNRIKIERETYVPAAYRLKSDSETFYVGEIHGVQKLLLEIHLFNEKKDLHVHFLLSSFKENIKLCLR